MRGTKKSKVGAAAKKVRNRPLLSGLVGGGGVGTWVFNCSLVIFRVERNNCSISRYLVAFFSFRVLLLT